MTKETDIHPIRQIFQIRRDERGLALVATLVFVALHALVIYHYNHIFMEPHGNYWAVFLHHFHLSGYDPITYSVVSVWMAKYNVYRHPLLAFFVAPLYWLNQLLWSLTGVNCAQYVVAAAWILVEVYGVVFFYRITCTILGVRQSNKVTGSQSNKVTGSQSNKVTESQSNKVTGAQSNKVTESQSKKGEALLLTALLYGFAHVMVAAVAPDHFILSMTMLLLVFYVCQQKMLQGRRLTAWQTVLLFVPTAGITLSNGIKVFLCALFTNGLRRFLRPKYLVLAVLLPSALIWATARVEYHYLVLPQEKVAHAKKKAAAKRNPRPQKHRANPNGKPISNGEFMRWTDITTSRTDAVVHNLFGEGIQLHRDHLLGDVLRHRPVVVRYQKSLPYVVESLLVLLLLAGIWCGRRSRFLWMMLSCVAFDMLLHLGLGFGLNEVYIMSCHWIFIIPFAIGYLLRAPSLRKRKLLHGSLLALCAALTVWLWSWNLSLMAGFLLQQSS